MLAVGSAGIKEGTVVLLFESPVATRPFRLDVHDGGEYLDGFDQRRQALRGNLQRPGAGHQQAVQVAAGDGLAVQFEGFAVIDGQVLDFELQGAPIHLVQQAP